MFKLRALLQYKLQLRLSTSVGMASGSSTWRACLTQAWLFPPSPARLDFATSGRTFGSGVSTSICATARFFW